MQLSQTTRETIYYMGHIKFPLLGTPHPLQGTNVTFYTIKHTVFFFFFFFSDDRQ